MIEVRPIPPTKKALRQYVHFGIDLYRNNPCFVPPLVLDEMGTLSPKENPAFEFCRAQSFMAYRDGKPAGRITALVNDKVNARTGKRQARFGWVDFVDDAEVSRALFAAAEDWARAQGMDQMVGPMGFSDMDREGMLVEGFDEMGTMATIYNHPYYPAHLERLGYQKAADWIEFRINVPDQVPEKMQRVAKMVMQRYGLKIKKYTSGAKAKADYGNALFELINEAYEKLYGYSPLSKRQIEYYVDMYLRILPLEFLSLVTDKDDRLVAVGISIPSLSQGLRRAGGRLLPMGWKHLLHALHGHNDVVDLLLIAVKPEYQNKGVNALLFHDLCQVFIDHGIKWAESNIELEDNEGVQQQWAYFDHRQHRRRRAYAKNL